MRFLLVLLVAAGCASADPGGVPADPDDPQEPEDPPNGTEDPPAENGTEPFAQDNFMGEGFAPLPDFVPADRPSRCHEPLLVGHRGSRFEAPENTLPAFVQAMAAGGDGVEIDVRLTADNELVAMHDSSTERTTDDASPGPVSEHTLAELKALDAGSWFGAQWAGTPVPTLDEIVGAVPEDTLLVLDTRAGAEQALVDFIVRRGIEARSVVAAFSIERLAFVRAELPEIRLAIFLSRLEQLEDPELQALELSFARAPIETQEQEWTHWEVVDAGYEPIVSSTYLTWNIGMVMVNDMENGVARRRDRKPAECD